MIYNILTVFILNLSDFKRVSTVSVAAHAKVLNKAIKILILGVLCVMIHIYKARIKAV